MMRSLFKRLGWAGSISLGIIVFCFLLAILAPVVAPFPAQGMGTPNITDKLMPPSAEHWLGTDHLGRDMVSRVIYGARVSLTTGMLIVALSLAIGLPVGLLAGYFGGWIDDALMRVTDVFLAFPALLLAVLMAAAMGAGMVNSTVAVAVTWWPWYARLARAEVLVLRGQPYVEAARVMGVSHGTIILRHILPSTSRPLAVQAALDFGPALLTASALSFLGLGILPPTADWGQMVNAGRSFFPLRWWYAAAPGVTIFVLALAFSVLGDALRGDDGGLGDAAR
ncbi:MULTISPECIES: ABC transporter permease [unclassified Ensifer]|uniref:ABC transporter permease n=1 Tax=unclassified Ensifer TaxID=2633371 RepID=UPI0008135125|nr:MULTISPECIES: ABC transporter permease [unclassified Ensifer]OCP25166.1 D-ala-D-ala transporter subunit [Ensifer sp. LC54]OCP25501.1 D-ala-D-ala transporter subunit [Ensifer sp. LC384]OCP34911.1 D-ala-D-ala transporter subunit [Ensifer sp. LC163]